MTDIKKTGTTTLGLVCKDCVVLAADMRATVGSMIDQTDIDKVFKIADNLALTMAGNVASIQMLIKHLQSEIKLREIRTGRTITVKESVNMLRNWVYGIIRQPSMMPEIAHFLFAGSDNYGTHLYDIFPDGSLMPISDYKSSGSGSVFAYGVLESQYKKDMTEKEGINLAVTAIDVAMKKDSGSGNGINVFVVDKSGVRKVLSKTVNNTLE